MRRISIIGLLLCLLIPAGSVANAAPVWTHGGPYGGWMTSFAFDPTHPSEVVAGTRFGGLFGSGDSGGTWHYLGLGGQDVNQVVFRSDGTLFAATSIGIFSSVNDGATMTLLTGGAPTASVRGVATTPAPTDLMYAISSAGVAHSTDGGANWTTSTSGLPVDLSSVQWVTIDPTNAGIVYVSIWGSGVYRSADTGATWTQFDVNGRNYISELHFDPAAPGTLWAGDGTGGLLNTTDGGAHWNTVTTPSFGVYSFAIDPTNSSRIVAGMSGAGMIITTNGGTSWSDANGTLSNSSQVIGATFDPNAPQTILGGELFRGGVRRSTDGGSTWSYSNQGLFATDIITVAADASAPSVAIASVYPGGLYKTTDTGHTWSPLGDITSWVNSLAIDPSHTQTIYAGTYFQGVSKSTDGGQTWNPMNTGLPANANVTIVHVDRAHPATILAAVQGNGLYVSANGGTSWTQGTTPAAPLPRAGVVDVGMMGDAPNGGTFVVENGTLYSTQDGDNFTTVTTPTAVVRADSFDGDIVYVDPDGVIHARGGFHGWDNLDAPCDPYPVVSVVLVPWADWFDAGVDVEVLCDDGSVLVFTDHGWLDITASFTDAPHAAASLVPRINGGIFVRANPSVIYEGTYGDGVWSAIVPPAAWMLTPRTPFERTTHVPASWSGNANAVTFTVDYRSASATGGFGSFAVWRDRTSAHSSSLTGVQGYTYCFKAEAFDIDGNGLGFGPQHCAAVPLDDRKMHRTSGWSSVAGASSDYLKTLTRSSSKGAELTTTVTTKRVEVLYETCDGCGSFEVLFGHTVLGKVSTQSASTHHEVAKIFTAFTSRAHGTVAIKITSSGRRVSIDGVGVSAV